MTAAAGPTGSTGPTGSFPYELIATDLDGTLLRSDSDGLEAGAREALAAVTAAGAAHIVVTGRAVPWTRHILDDLGYEGLAVCGQGAQVYDAGEHRLLTSVTLDRQLAGLALAKIEAEVGPLLLAASHDGSDGEVLVGPGYRRQDGSLPVVAIRDATTSWSAPLDGVRAAPHALRRRTGRGGRRGRGRPGRRHHGGRRG